MYPCLTARFVAVNWALQPHYWCSTAETLLQTVWSFRGGKRSPVSPSLPFTGLPSPFISQANLPRVLPPYWPWPFPCSKPVLSPSQGPHWQCWLPFRLLSDIAGLNFVLWYLFWITCVLSHSSHASPSSLSDCLTVEVNLREDYWHCWEGSCGRPPRCFRSRSSAPQGCCTRPLCVPPGRPLRLLTHTVDG